MLAIAMVIVLVASWPWIRVGKTHSAMECFLSSLLNTKSTASNGEEKHACWDTFLLPIFVPTFMVYSQAIFTHSTADAAVWELSLQMLLSLKIIISEWRRLAMSWML